MEKILQAIASLVEELKSKDEKILELERKLDGCLLELEDKNKKIQELTDENTRLTLEKISPLQPNPVRPLPCDPDIPWTPNLPSIPCPNWTPYGPVITYTGHSADIPCFVCEMTI